MSSDHTILVSKCHMATLVTVEVEDGAEWRCSECQGVVGFRANVGELDLGIVRESFDRGSFGPGAEAIPR